MVTQRPTTNKRLLKLPLILAAALLLVAAIIATLELTNMTHIFHTQKKPQSKTITTAGTPVEPPKQDTSTPSPTKPSDRELSTNNSQPGGATDTRGSASTNTDSNKWITSQGGYITVKSPIANSKLANGAVVAGTAKVDQISYRLTDNVTGVIAQGQLTVTDGKFSGNLHFQPKGTGGRLDIFNTDASGTEYNEIQINVSF